MEIPKGEVLYRKKPNGRYEPAYYELDNFYKFPKGRWVLLVEDNCTCCLKATKNVDENLLTSLYTFKSFLIKSLEKFSRPKIMGKLTKKQLKEIEKICKGKLIQIATETAGTIAQNAIEEFAEIVNKAKSN